MDQYEYIEEIDDDIEDIIEVEDDIEYIEEVYKFNPNHGKDGRFATGNGNGTSSGTNDDAYRAPTGFSINKNGEKTLDSAEKKRYSEKLVGGKTSDGIEIRNISQHAYDRAAQRNLSPGQIKDALKASPSKSKSDESCNTYDADGHRIVVNNKTGNIVTIMHRRGAK